VRFEVRSVTGLQGDMVDALSIHALCEPLGEHVGVHLLINDLDDVRGALQADARGRAPRGSLAALIKLLKEDDDR
jgi:hypothetical protein